MQRYPRGRRICDAFREVFEPDVPWGLYAEPTVYDSCGSSYPPDMWASKARVDAAAYTEWERVWVEGDKSQMVVLMLDTVFRMATDPAMKEWREKREEYLESLGEGDGESEGDGQSEADVQSKADV